MKGSVQAIYSPTGQAGAKSRIEVEQEASNHGKEFLLLVYTLIWPETNVVDGTY